MTDIKQDIYGKFLNELDGWQYLSVFDDFSGGVIATNVEGVIVYYNRSMSRIDDLEPDKVIGRKVTDVYDLDDSTSIIMQCLAIRKPIIDEPIYYRTRMGKFANTIHNVMPIFNDARMVGSICIVRDYHALLQTIDAMPLPESEEQFDTKYITFDQIVGNSPVFLNAINSARMAAATPSPVMLFGETGTGKELFARAIHNHGPRSTRKFTPVNCAAIPENLLEGILFGTSRGAFTGAVEKAGLFERTSRGTLFLDEVNSMPVGLQGKILRSIQENRIRRVGALKEIEIDLKIISSVNQSPHAAISNGTLRSDLFYRLGVVFIHIVPLRDRMDDLDLLVGYFIKKHNAMLKKNVSRVSDEVMELFKLYDWPGNVRELEHVIEGSMNIVGQNDVIQSHHLQTHFSNWSVKHPAARKKTENVRLISPGGSPARIAVKDPEKEAAAVRTALHDHHGNITRTAAALGISRQLLYYKIRKYAISRPGR